MKTKNKVIIIILSFILILTLIGLGIFFFVINTGDSEKSSAVKHAQSLNPKETIVYKMKNPHFFYDAIEGTYEGSEGIPDNMITTGKGKFIINNYKQLAFTKEEHLDASGSSTLIAIFQDGKIQEYRTFVYDDSNEIVKDVKKSSGYIYSLGILDLTIPAQISQFFLIDENNWEIQDTIDYLGRESYLIEGTFSPEINSTIGDFKVIVDKATGIVFYFEYYSKDTGMLQVKEITKINIIDISGDSPKYSDSSILNDQSVFDIEGKEEYTEYEPSYK